MATSLNRLLRLLSSSDHPPVGLRSPSIFLQFIYCSIHFKSSRLGLFHCIVLLRDHSVSHLTQEDHLEIYFVSICVVITQYFTMLLSWQSEGVSLLGDTGNTKVFSAQPDTFLRQPNYCKKHSTVISLFYPDAIQSILNWMLRWNWVFLKKKRYI